MPKEQPQSLESQLKMARPKRAEVKRVPLTPEEKEFLGKIMDKAVAAEKAGELQEALDLYTDYKNELLKIKERKEEEEKEWTEQDLIHWAIRNLGLSTQRAERYVEANFVLDELPIIQTKGNMTFNNMILEDLPNVLHVNGSFVSTNCTIKKMPNALYTNENCILRFVKINQLPKTMIIGGLLDMTKAEINNKKEPESLHVEEEVYVSESDPDMVKEIEKFKKQGDIKGDIKIT